MKIFSSAQLRAWDQYTIVNEPVSSIDLMERAARACFYRIMEITGPGAEFIIFAGPGNNGGDGFAIARILAENHHDVRIYHFSSPTLSPDCRTNIERWKNLGFQVNDITREDQVPETFEKGKIIIDAIFGTGQSRPLEGIYATACMAINASGLPVISIDLPSGIFCDESSALFPHIRASHTLSLQSAKLCFFLPENHRSFGQISIIDIGLSRTYYEQTEAIFNSFDIHDARQILKPRDEYAHKGKFGNALLLAGSMGMMGAALLAAKASLRSGVGKLFCAIPSESLTIFQQALPEAICITDPEKRFLTTLPPGSGQYQSIGAGPGIGKEPGTRTMIRSLLKECRQPLILDADALNIIAEDQLIGLIPKNAVLTPHVAEFTRLFGSCGNDFERARLALSKAREFNISIILKGKHTLLATPGGKGYFNITGNAGMAKGGSGDVLTGMITGLAAYYPLTEACKLAVFLHGMAGDLARDKHSEHAMLASDIIEEIGPSFKKLA